MFEGQPQAEIDALIKSNPEFKQLYQRHRTLDKKVADAEIGVLPIDDATLGQMKREKLHAKEKLLQIYARAHGPGARRPMPAHVSCRERWRPSSSAATARALVPAPPLPPCRAGAQLAGGRPDSGRGQTRLLREWPLGAGNRSR